MILKKSEEKGGRGLVPATGWKLFSSSAHLVPSPQPYHHYTKTKCPCVPAFGVKIAQKCLGFDYFSYFCIKYRRYAVKTVQAQSDLIP